MRLSCALVTASILYVPNGILGATGWEGKTAVKSAAVAGRRVFDRHGRFIPGVSCSNTMAFDHSPSTASAGKELPIVDSSAQGVPGLRAETAKDSSGDPPSQLQGAVRGVLHTVRDFFVDAKTGTVALWTNFQTSQDIRKRVKGGHQLTYAEHAHLERGANDRRKLLQYAVIYAISPDTFPYIVLYAPSLLPSTFEKQHAVRAKYRRFALERVAATVIGLSQLEKQLLDAEAKLKGKSRKPGTRQTRGLEALEAQREDTLKILKTDSKKRAFDLLQGQMIAVVPPAVDEEQGGGAGGQGKVKKKTTKEKRGKLPKACKGLPNPAVKALGKGMGLAGWRGIAPAFYARYMLNMYAKELGRGDEVLRRQPLDSLSDSDLREACNARAIDVGDDRREGDTQALRKYLAEWLELTSAGDAAARKAGPDTVFLQDRARLLGLGLNFLENARLGKRGELTRRAMFNSW